MGIITDITIPGSEFEVGPSLEGFEDVHATFEQVVPTGKNLFPYLWVYSDFEKAVEPRLESNPAIANVRRVYEDEGQDLYEISWASETEKFLGCLRDTKAVVLKAGGTAATWEFQLRFDQHEDLSEFQSKCMDSEITLTVDRIVTKSVVDSPGQNLTDAQRETIEVALRRGYFDVPRKCTMVELADELGISDQAVSARIRRAMKKLSKQLFLFESASEKPERPEIKS